MTCTSNKCAAVSTGGQTNSAGNTGGQTNSAGNTGGSTTVQDATKKWVRRGSNTCVSWAKKVFDTTNYLAPYKNLTDSLKPPVNISDPLTNTVGGGYFLNYKCNCDASLNYTSDPAFATVARFVPTWDWETKDLFVKGMSAEQNDFSKVTKNSDFQSWMASDSPPKMIEYRSRVKYDRCVKTEDVGKIKKSKQVGVNLGITGTGVSSSVG